VISSRRAGIALAFGFAAGECVAHEVVVLGVDLAAVVVGVERGEVQRQGCFLQLLKGLQEAVARAWLGPALANAPPISG
jgi:hypothetical protein